MVRAVSRRADRGISGPAERACGVARGCGVIVMLAARALRSEGDDRIGPELPVDAGQLHGDAIDRSAGHALIRPAQQPGAPEPDRRDGAAPFLRAFARQCPRIPRVQRTLSVPASLVTARERHQTGFVTALQELHRCPGEAEGLVIGMCEDAENSRHRAILPALRTPYRWSG